MQIQIFSPRGAKWHPEIGRTGPTENPATENFTKTPKHGEVYRESQRAIEERKREDCLRAVISTS